MIRTTRGVTLGLCLSTATAAGAQPPEAYALKATETFAGRTRTLTIVRDGARERVEKAIEKAGTMVSLYDFAAHKVYWIGWSGAGSCSSGRYLSARAPVSEDPVTAAGDDLAALAEGRSSAPTGKETVAGQAARVLTFAAGKRSAGGNAAPRATRVWLAEEGGYLLKVEAEGPGGKPATLLEVTQLTVGKPQGAALEPPAECTATDSELDDAGSLHARASASVTAEGGGTAQLAGAKAGAKPGALARIDAMTLTVVPQPHDGPCGTRLQLTATVTVDGPATIRYGFRSSVGGLRFEDGENGILTADGAGSVTLTKAAQLTRALKGQLRLQAIVQGVKGHDGPMKTSAAVPFEVSCAAP